MDLRLRHDKSTCSFGAQYHNSSIYGRVTQKSLQPPTSEAQHLKRHQRAGGLAGPCAGLSRGAESRVYAFRVEVLGEAIFDVELRRGLEVKACVA